MNEIVQMSLTEVADAIRTKKVSSVEATQACIAQAEKWQPKINAYVTFDPDGALAQAHGHGELIYDFSQGGSGDGWLHGLVRIRDKTSGHAADSSFGSHLSSERCALTASLETNLTSR